MALNCYLLDVGDGRLLFLYRMRGLNKNKLRILIIIGRGLWETVESERAVISDVIELCASKIFFHAI